MANAHWAIYIIMLSMHYGKKQESLKTRSKIYRCDSGLVSMIAMDSKDSKDSKDSNDSNDSIIVKL